MLKKRIALVIIAVMLLSIIGGCSNGGLGDNENSVEDILIKDMANRELTIPKNSKKAFSITPTGTILLYSLNPESLLGWNYDLKDGEKAYIDEKYHNLPNLGGAGGEGTNMEEILKLDPDFLILMEDLNDGSIEKAEKLEEQTNKPVILIDTVLHKLDEAYSILGELLGEEEKAGELAQYARETMDEIDDGISKISEDEKIAVYYAEGPMGLETEASGSWHMEVLDLAGARNVADVSLEAYKGQAEVYMEQLLEWNPSLIISWGDQRGGYYSQIFTDPNWKDIRAVKDGEVYEIPNNPFNWLDRPPSVNRLLGVKWMGNLLYPQVFNYNMEEVVREFYQKFYHHDLSQDELRELLANSTRQ